MGDHLVVCIRMCGVSVDGIHEAAVLWLTGGTGVCAGGGCGCGCGRPTSVVAVQAGVCVVLGLSPGGVIPSDAERHACWVCAALSRCRLFTGEGGCILFGCDCCVAALPMLGFDWLIPGLFVYSGDRRSLGGRGGVGLV